MVWKKKHFCRLKHITSHSFRLNLISKISLEFCIGKVHCKQEANQILKTFTLFHVIKAKKSFDTERLHYTNDQMKKYFHRF